MNFYLCRTNRFMLSAIFSCDKQKGYGLADLQKQFYVFVLNSKMDIYIKVYKTLLLYTIIYTYVNQQIQFFLEIHFLWLFRLKPNGWFLLWGPREKAVYSYTYRGCVRGWKGYSWFRVVWHCVQNSSFTAIFTFLKVRFTLEMLKPGGKIMKCL